MKACVMLGLAALVAAAAAEAPAAPYPPSGWRPAKAFLLPVQFRQRYEGYAPPPAAAYGAPAPGYGPPAPAPSYGPPPQPTEAPEEEPTTTEAAVTEEATTEPTTEPNTEPQEETTEAGDEGRGNEEALNEVSQPSGLYYVLLPDGRLQRVVYTPGSPEAGYSAQLRIADVEPQPPAPVYAYAGPLTRILRRAN